MAVATSPANAEWAERFKAATVHLALMDVETISYEESAKRLRTLLRSKLLLHTDLIDNPERFFLAHRILAEHAPALGPGFWIRFTVHYNLCVGTVLGLGSDEQIAALQDMQNEGLLGCFGLTEKLAGVSSGLVVHTTAHWDPVAEEFTINSQNTGASKNWISQGLVADKTIVMASLIIGERNHGPHAFFIDLRRNGELVPGVYHGDMGKKTVGNDLDNAWISFNNVKAPKSALLNRYADIENNKYVQKVQRVPIFHMIGQRLFTGRVAVAQAALEFRRALFAMTRKYTDNRECWVPTGTRPLSAVPQLKALYEENEANQRLVDGFVGRCEAELCACLKAGKMPPVGLTDAIAVCKVKAVEDSIEFVQRLQNEVGSYALMKGSGFEQRDFLTCCKFAEGDSRVLMQKMSRDRVKQFTSSKGSQGPGSEQERALCADLAAALRTGGPGAWDDNYTKVYALAGLIIERTVDAVMKPQANL